MNEKNLLNGVKEIGNTFIIIGAVMVLIYFIIRLIYPDQISAEYQNDKNFFWIVVVQCIAIDTICTSFIRGFSKKN